MFTTIRNNAQVYSSENIGVGKLTGANASTQVFSASARDKEAPGSQSIHPANIELRRQDNTMRLHIMNSSVTNKDANFRPATPRLSAKMHWETVMATPQSKMDFLARSQTGRNIGLVHEDALESLIDSEKSRGHFCESNMDMGVACEPRATSNGTLGAGPCVLGFIRAVAANGRHTIASVHVGLDRDNPLNPETAFQQVISPLARAIAEKTGNTPTNKFYYFAGGNPHTFDSCVALAYAAQQRQLNVPVSMLAINTEDTYINAVMTKPTPQNPNGAFYLAKVDD